MQAWTKGVDPERGFRSGPTLFDTHLVDFNPYNAE